MKFFSAFLFIILFSAGLSANNILVSNSSLTGQNTSAGPNNAANFIQVKFNVSWENSWRNSTGPSNWDAAWVFVKFRISGGNWQHAWLNNTGHVQPSGSTINPALLTPGVAFNVTTNPAIGVFIYRSVNGTGTFTSANAQLRWNYGAQGVPDSASLEIKVFAIEMVYAPQSAFNVGGGSGAYSFTPTTINTSNATTASSGTGSLGGKAGGYPTGQVAPSNAGWPNGFSAFYCMKYEITQQQYVDFLNTLTRVQQSARVGSDISVPYVIFQYVLAQSFGVDTRNSVRCDYALPAAPAPVNFFCDYNGNGIGGESNDGLWIACNWINWSDLAAFLDWSCLRPMTELEFEKVCRGNLPAVFGEYAWGTNTLTAAPAGLINAGQANEVASNSAANCSYEYYLTNAVHGPMRVGCFAKAGSSRIASGAGYYGVMDMCGSLWERIITIANVRGRTFSGAHGNGMISSSGASDVPNWPDATAMGTGMKGCDWLGGGDNMWLSSRGNSEFVDNSRQSTFGGRGVRTAP